MVRTIFLNGTVGSGKTTTLYALSNLLVARGMPHANINMDDVTNMCPPPPNDVFNETVGLANVRALAANYAAAGATLLLIAGVIEEQRMVHAYAEAVGERAGAGGGFTVVRLTCSGVEGARRLKARHGGVFGDPAELEWHLHRLDELAGILDASGIEGPVVATDGTTPEMVARAVYEGVFARGLVL